MEEDRQEEQWPERTFRGEMETFNKFKELFISLYDLIL